MFSLHSLVANCNICVGILPLVFLDLSRFRINLDVSMVVTAEKLNLFSDVNKDLILMILGWFEYF